MIKYRVFEGRWIHHQAELRSNPSNTQHTSVLKPRLVSWSAPHRPIYTQTWNFGWDHLKTLINQIRSSAFGTTYLPKTAYILLWPSWHCWACSWCAELHQSTIQDVHLVEEINSCEKATAMWSTYVIVTWYIFSLDWYTYSLEHKN